MLAYAKFGVVLFGLLLLVGLVHARARDGRTLAAAGWDHAVMAGAAATGLLLVSHRLGLVAVAAAVVMAVARVYVAAHYPWDVLAVLLLGAGAAGLWLLLRVPLISWSTWLRRQPGLHALFSPQGSARWRIRIDDN